VIAGRTAQEFNIRKNRKGAFWEDRYHATAVQTDVHLAKCLVYIDLNMVRAGVVKHPSEYGISGYNEIQNPPERYSIINRKTLMELFDTRNDKSFRKDHHDWVETELKNEASERNPSWSESIAVGSKHFVENIQHKLGVKALGRSVSSREGMSVLKEPHAPYKALFATQKRPLSLKNSYYLPINS
jgi:REP-associated tyrosine transposase